MVTDHADWSERSAVWIRAAMDHGLPLLGVCYGHQLMAYALGGEVADNPNGWERGLLPINCMPEAQRDPLLKKLPQDFSVWLSHRQSVISAPQQAQVLAASARDGCQIVRYSPQALSVQFHPEFSRHIMNVCMPKGCTEDGANAMEGKDWARELLVAFWQQTRPAMAQAQGA